MKGNIFAKIATLSQLKGLVERAFKCLWKCMLLYESLIKIAQNTAMLGGRVGLIDEQGQDRVSVSEKSKGSEPVD
jgi:hypothetical protein